MQKNFFTLSLSFTGSYTEEEPNFPWQNDLILQKKVSGVDRVVNFKGFSRPNKKIKYFSRTETEFKDFSRRLVKFKTFSKLYEPCQVAQERYPKKFDLAAFLHLI